MNTSLMYRGKTTNASMFRNTKKIKISLAGGDYL